jgi:hypothetical protein
MKKSIDIQQFKKTLLLTKEYLGLHINSSSKALDILAGMVDDTLDKLNQKVSNNNISYDHADIHEFGWPNEKHSELSFLSPKTRLHRKKIIVLTKPEGDLFKFLKARGSESVLTFESNESKGGAGSRNLMWLGMKTDSMEIVDSGTTAIYKAVELNKPFNWVQPMTKTALKGWGFWGFILVPICSVLGIPLLIFSLSLFQSSIYTLFVIVCVYVLWRLGYIIYELMEKGVAKAPDWMVRISDRNALFAVSRENSTDKEKRKAKIIELITYEAECPICNDIILIERGGKEFNGRYVGKCTLAPKEHVFSFDHVTKKGKYFRGNCY